MTHRGEEASADKSTRARAGVARQVNERIPLDSSTQSESVACWSFATGVQPELLTDPRMPHALR
jgi:hypothetical protein